MDPRVVRETLAIARRTHRAALGAARLEELRSLASGWRWVHRWIAALLLALLALHVTHALLYSESLREVLR